MAANVKPKREPSSLYTWAVGCDSRWLATNLREVAGALPFRVERATLEQRWAYRVEISADIKKAPRSGPSSAQRCSVKGDAHAAAASSCQFFGRITSSIA